MQCMLFPDSTRHAFFFTSFFCFLTFSSYLPLSLLIVHIPPAGEWKYRAESHFHPVRRKKTKTKNHKTNKQENTTLLNSLSAETQRGGKNSKIVILLHKKQASHQDPKKVFMSTALTTNISQPLQVLF